MTAARPSIVHVTTVHPTFDTRVFHRECRSTARAGFSAGLVASHDRDETVDGIQILALGAFGSRIARVVRGQPQALRRLNELDPDIAHLHDPELIPLGLLLKARGIKVVMDIHEDVPAQILQKEWLPRITRRPISALASLVVRFAVRVMDATIVAEPGVMAGLESDRCVLVQNYPDLGEDGRRRAASGSPARSDSQVCYVGGISNLRGAAQMVQAMALVRHPGSRLTLAGRLPDTLGERLRSIDGWDRVDPVGRLDRTDVWELLGRSAVGLAVLLPAPNYIDSQPTKLFEYMAAGLPVVASDFPRWRRIVDDAECGLLVDPRDPQAIAAAIDWLLEHPEDAARMGANGARAVEDRYSWESEERRLVATYRELLSPSTRS